MKKGKILLIEDKKEILDDLSFSLQINNYQALCAPSINDGVELIHENDIQFIIVDLKFEQDDKEKEFGGLKLFHLLYQLKTTINVIILSACSFEGEKDNFLSQLKQLRNNDEGIDNILKNMHKVYVCKHGEYRYSERILAMIKLFDDELILKCKDFWQDIIGCGSCGKTMKLIKDLLKMIADDENRHTIIMLSNECNRLLDEEIRKLTPATALNDLSGRLLKFIQKLIKEDFDLVELAKYAVANKIK